MPRVAGVHWDKSKGAWRTDAGGKTTYFRGIAKTDRAGAREAFEAYVKTLASRSANPDDPTVEQVAEAYLAHVKATARPRTAEGHQEMLVLFADHPNPASPSRYGLRRARQIRAADLAVMEQAWAAAGRSPNYRARLVRTVKACWAWASRGDRPILPANPLKDAAGVAVPYSRKRRVDDGQARGFLAFIRGRAEGMTPLMARFTLATADLIEFVRETGCRPGEACSARWDQYQPDRGLILQAEHKTSGKTGRPRKIILTARAAEIVERIRALPDHHPEFIFTHKRGRGAVGRGAAAAHGEPWEARVLSQKIRKLRQAAIAAGVPLRDDLTLYDFRHEWISGALARGVTADRVGAVVGNQPRVIHRHYEHWDDEDLRAIVGEARGDD
jgi:integrase